MPAATAQRSLSLSLLRSLSSLRCFHLYWLKDPGGVDRPQWEWHNFGTQGFPHLSFKGFHCSHILVPLVPWKIWVQAVFEDHQLWMSPKLLCHSFKFFHSPKKKDTIAGKSIIINSFSLLNPSEHGRVQQHCSSLFSLEQPFGCPSLGQGNAQSSHSRKPVQGCSN
ncbi:uncharacterized protein LOC112270937 [Brachypodium distachyon]|uniref:Uncharacterized protein n=1 Tax=Brachypodium distachyon TaxID=15368 RepID=A0A2K2D6X6_BRADI|nr:uncharacterized protein LOC112270937 [Brachypodium distachyon]PNT70037.1 hypothetical protein BRADI_2g04336v3 [Brachypodium distachyon]|eukprot:XP_024315401.1 uncharacterized protein LOC112270937 [Brachypodium distachyon]